MSAAITDRRRAAIGNGLAPGLVFRLLLTDDSSRNDPQGSWGRAMRLEL